MTDKYLKYEPGTRTHKTPMPTSFGHLLKFITKEENFLGLHSQEDITNINNQLNQTLNLMVSNIIQRVIAQIIGQTPTGFVTIKGTQDGALQVSVQEDPVSSKVLKQVAINENTAASNEIIAAIAGKQLCIVNLVFTVGGEINITLQSATNALSGAMDFGGTNEPRGFVSNHGDFPLKTVSGEAFNILMSAAVQVSGYVVYYEE